MKELKLLVVVLVLVSAACGRGAHEPPSKPAAPTWTTYYVSRAATEVMAAGKLSRLAAYGESMTAACEGGTCRLRGGVETVSAADVLPYSPPVQKQYALDATTASTVRPPEHSVKLRAGQQVLIQEYRSKQGLARIDDRHWVEFDKLRDHPKTAAERSAEARSAAAERKVGELTRRAYALKLRDVFLDRGMDIKVTIGGRNADRLLLRYVLFNAVWVHQFEKGDLVAEIRGLGFNAVDFNNGYDYHVVYSWK